MSGEDGERRVDMKVLEERIGHLAEAIRDLVTEQKAMRTEVTAICKDCKLPGDVETLKIAVATMNGKAAGFSVGAGAVTSAIAFALAHLFRVK